MKEYKQINLKNGLRIILAPKKSTEVVTVMAMFGVGSRNENDEIGGISHVLEHMHYKGTKKRPTSMKISEFIESIGGAHNAFTGKEITGYYAKVTPKHLEHAFDFLSDNLTNSKFDKAELKRERNVILEELKMYLDLPMVSIENKFEEAVFGKNDLGRDIIGSRKSIKNTTREKIIKYRDNFYKADNSVIVLAGNFGEYSENKIKNLAEKYFKFPRGKKEKMNKIVLNDQKSLSITKKKTEQSHIVIGFKTVPFDHKDYFKLELLATILGGGMSSRMFEEVREKRGLAYSVKTSCSNYLESGALFTQAGVPHKKVYEAVGAILNEYKKVSKNLIPESELNKAKEVVCGRLLIKFEDSEEVANHYALEAILSKKIITPAELIIIYRKITVKDILEVVRKYFIDKRMGMALIGKDINKEKVNKLLSM